MGFNQTFNGQKSDSRWFGAMADAKAPQMDREPAEVKVIVYYAKGVKSSHDRKVR